jgi:hypothetical protein
MRIALAALAMIVSLVAAAPAFSAPTCLRLDGLATRCRTPGAMPAGWRPTTEQQDAWRRAQPPSPVGFEVVGALALIAALATLIAAMPQFDGWNAEDWDEQEGENRRRG